MLSAMARKSCFAHNDLPVTHIFIDIALIIISCYLCAHMNIAKEILQLKKFTTLSYAFQINIEHKHISRIGLHFYTFQIILHHML